LKINSKLYSDPESGPGVLLEQLRQSLSEEGLEKFENLYDENEDED